MTWSAAPGDVDHYEVQLLFSDMKVFPPITLGSGVGECVLSSLTPGRLYKILVSTYSGPNQKAQHIEGRTGQTQDHRWMMLSSDFLFKHVSPPRQFPAG